MGQSTELSTEPRTAAREGAGKLRRPYTPGTQTCLRALMRTTPGMGFPGGPWLRIYLPMQGTWVRSLVQEDPNSRGTAKPVRHHY